MPRKDAHPNEKVTAAVDVYNAPPKADIFITHYSEEGILPVLLVITNDGDQPITREQDARGVGDRPRATSWKRSTWTTSSAAWRTSRETAIPRTRRTHHAARRQQEQEGAAAVRRNHARTFRRAAVEPHSTQSGFLFFDVRDVKQPVAGAHIYLTGMRDSNGNELMYFEIPLTPSNAANAGRKVVVVTMLVSKLVRAICSRLYNRHHGHHAGSPGRSAAPSTSRSSGWKSTSSF